jgi:hypothetical protein
MAHMLELVTGLCFKGPGVAETMKLARALVGSIKGSSRAAAELARVLAFMNLPVLAITKMLRHGGGVLTLWCSGWFVSSEP